MSAESDYRWAVGLCVGDLVSYLRQSTEQTCPELRAAALRRVEDLLTKPQGYVVSQYDYTRADSETIRTMLFNLLEQKVPTEVGSHLYHQLEQQCRVPTVAEAALSLADRLLSIAEDDLSNISGDVVNELLEFKQARARESKP